MDEKLKEQLRDYCTETYKRVTEKLTDFALKLFEELYPTLPDILSDDEKIKLLKEALNVQADSLIGSVEHVDYQQMAADIAKRTKGV